MLRCDRCSQGQSWAGAGGLLQRRWVPPRCRKGCRTRALPGGEPTPAGTCPFSRALLLQSGFGPLCSEGRAFGDGACISCCPVHLRAWDGRQVTRPPLLSPQRLHTAVLGGQQRAVGELSHQPERALLPPGEPEMRHLVQVHPDGAERSGPRAHQRDHRGQDAGERYARPSRLPAPLFLRWSGDRGHRRCVTVARSCV